MSAYTDTTPTPKKKKLHETGDTYNYTRENYMKTHIEKLII